MSRQPLPTPRQKADDAALFPAFQREMNRLLDQFKSGFPSLNDDARSFFSGISFPAIDVVETDDALEVSAEIPGVKEDDIDATIAGEVLTLKGEKSVEHEGDEDGYHLIERRYGSFRRQIPLGFIPEEGAVKSQFEDGILTLRIAKPAKAKSTVQKIQIKKNS